MRKCSWTYLRCVRTRTVGNIETFRDTPSLPPPSSSSSGIVSFFCSKSFARRLLGPIGKVTNPTTALLAFAPDPGPQVELLAALALHCPHKELEQMLLGNGCLSVTLCGLSNVVKKFRQDGAFLAQKKKLTHIHSCTCSYVRFLIFYVSCMREISATLFVVEWHFLFILGCWLLISNSEAIAAFMVEKSVLENSFGEICTRNLYDSQKLFETCSDMGFQTLMYWGDNSEIHPRYVEAGTMWNQKIEKVGKETNIFLTLYQLVFIYISTRTLRV